MKSLLLLRETFEEYKDAVVGSGGAIGLKRGDVWKGQRPGWQGRPKATAEQSKRTRAGCGTS